MITKEMSINEVIAKYPHTLKIFNEFNFDSCCGGAETLEKSAKDKNIDVEVVLKKLNEINP